MDEEMGNNHMSQGQTPPLPEPTLSYPNCPLQRSNAVVLSEADVARLTHVNAVGSGSGLNGLGVSLCLSLLGFAWLGGVRRQR